MSERLLNLDTLRGLAAILVVWQHGSEVFIHNPELAHQGMVLASFISQVDFGKIGVLCFFLISGFVIPHSMLAANRSLKNFAIRRFFRLYPAYWVSLTVATVLAWLLHDQILPASTILANTTMLQGLLGFGNVQLLYWTLTAELIFYCLCAVMFAQGQLGSPKKLLLLCWGGLSLFISLQLLEQSATHHFQFPTYIIYLPFAIAVMFCGALIRYNYETNTGRHYTLWAVASTFSIPLLVWGLYILGWPISDDPIRFALSHLIALGIFLMTVSIPFRPLRFMASAGTISYSIYLFHLTVVYLMKWAMSQPWGEMFIGYPLAIYLAVTTAVSLALAGFIYRFIERPFIRLGRVLSGDPLTFENAHKKKGYKIIAKA
ncbi:acyltransferase [Microbulbifer sp. OS29]|uniref:Acyltransferase n=1 Tax=Microbulbifer okhotskensis TaxID=2926617 RepID=A0A9X2J6R2_9GAMM|nr:acyltransferase [Microbulbifer okhotskensis]MCO1333751.1 acyltransferase [Microbulbifer okhotskensis]